MTRLTQLLHIDVVDEDGNALGSLMDLRARRAARGRVRDNMQLDTLVLGAKGLLEHIGLRGAASPEAAWKDVVRIERERIVVRNKRKRTA